MADLVELVEVGHLDNHPVVCQVFGWVKHPTQCWVDPVLHLNEQQRCVPDPPPPPPPPSGCARPCKATRHTLWVTAQEQQWCCVFDNGCCQGKRVRIRNTHVRTRRTTHFQSLLCPCLPVPSSPSPAFSSLLWSSSAAALPVSVSITGSTSLYSFLMHPTTAKKCPRRRQGAKGQTIAAKLQLCNSSAIHSNQLNMPCRPPTTNSTS